MNSIAETLPHIVKLYLLLLLFVCTISAVGSTIAYVYASPRWFANPIGSHMVWFMICLSMFLLFYVVRLLWPLLPGREFLLVGLFTFLAVVLMWRFVLFIRLGLEVRRERRKLAELRSEEDERG